MAVDGGIYINITIDTSGIAAEMADLLKSANEFGKASSEAFTEASQKLEDYNEDVKETTEATETASSETGKFAAVMNKLVAALSPVASAVVSLGKKAFGVLKSGIQLAAKPVKGLMTAFSGFVQSTSLINLAAKGISKAFSKLGDIVKDVAKKAFKALVQTIKEGVESLASYSEGVGEAMSALQTETEYLKSNIVAAFAPIIEAVVPILAAMVGGVNTAVTALGQLIAAISGKSTYTKAVKQQKDYAKSLDGTTGAVGEATEAVNELGDAVDTMPDGGALFEDATIPAWINTVAERIGRLFDPLVEAWAAKGQKVMGAWDTAIKAVGGAVLDIGKSFIKVWENGAAQRTAENLLNLFAEIGLWIGDIALAWQGAWESKGDAVVESVSNRLNSALELIHSISDSFREALNAEAGVTMLENVFSIFTNLNETVAAFTERIREAWEANGNGLAIAETLFQFVNDILGSLDSMTEAALDWATALNLEPIITSFHELLQGIEPVVDIITGLLAWAFENILLPIGTWLFELAVPEALGMLADAFEMIGAVLEAIQPTALWLWEEFLVPLGEWVADGILSALDFLGEKFQQVTDWMKENGDDINVVLQTIGEVFKFIWENIVVGAVENAWNMIKGLIDGILEVFGGLITFLAGVFTGDWEKAWEGVKKIFSGIWNIIASVLEGVLNGIISGLNFFIRALNQINITVPDWVPFMGGKNFGFNIPEIGNVSIPRLAQGGVIPPNREFLAVLGDQRSGYNVEAPLSMIEDAVKRNSGGAGKEDIKAAIREVLRELGLTGDAFNVAVELDGRDLTRGVRKYEGMLGQSYGGPAFATVR